MSIRQITSGNFMVHFEHILPYVSEYIEFNPNELKLLIDLLYLDELPSEEFLANLKSSFPIPK